MLLFDGRIELPCPGDSESWEELLLPTGEVVGYTGPSGAQLVCALANTAEPAQAMVEALLVSGYGYKEGESIELYAGTIDGHEAVTTIFPHENAIVNLTVICLGDEERLVVRSASWNGAQDTTQQLFEAIAHIKVIGA